ncbi:MAG TPA: hypothetical protein VGA77_15385, partial [Propylenella sp.]
MFPGFRDNLVRRLPRFGQRLGGCAPDNDIAAACFNVDAFAVFYPGGTYDFPGQTNCPIPALSAHADPRHYRLHSMNIPQHILYRRFDQ